MKKVLIIFVMFFAFSLNVKASDDIVEQANYYVSEFLLYGNEFNYNKSNELINQLPNSSIKNELQEKVNIKYQEEQKLIKNREYKEFSKLIFYIIILLTIFLIISFKYDREYKSSFNEKYLRDIPNDYEVLKVSYLMEKKINKHCISAILMDLIRKKIILCEKNKNKELVLKKSKDIDTVSDIEKSVINLFFNNKKEITLKELKESKKKKRQTYLNNLNKFVKLAKNEFTNYDFYVKDEVSKKPKNKFFTWLSVIIITILIMMLNPITIIFIVPILIALVSGKMGRLRKICIGIVTCVIFLLFVEIKELGKFNWSLDYWKYLYIFLIFIGVLIMSYIIKANKKTKEGISEYHKWLAFKNFIRDFGVFEIKNIEDVYLREKYLVYATLFGYSKKISKEVKFNIDENDIFAIDIICNSVFNVNMIPVIISNILYHNDDF